MTVDNSDGYAPDAVWKAGRDIAEDADSECPRWQLREAEYTPVAKCTDLRELGYQIVTWISVARVRDGNKFAVCYEYVPRPNIDGSVPDGKGRYVAWTFEDQRDFHQRIGAARVATQGSLF